MNRRPGSRMIFFGRSNLTWVHSFTKNNSLSIRELTWEQYACVRRVPRACPSFKICKKRGTSLPYSCSSSVAHSEDKLTHSSKSVQYPFLSTSLIPFNLRCFCATDATRRQLRAVPKEPEEQHVEVLKVISERQHGCICAGLKFHHFHIQRWLSPPTVYSQFVSNFHHFDNQSWSSWEVMDTVTASSLLFEISTLWNEERTDTWESPVRKFGLSFDRKSSVTNDLRVSCAWRPNHRFPSLSHSRTQFVIIRVLNLVLLL